MHNTKPPIKTNSNKFHEGIAESVKSTIGPFSPLFNLIWPSFHQKEIEKWREEVYLELERLSKNNEKYELQNLIENKEFTSILIQAIQIAHKNFQKEKLDQLKEIIIKSPVTEFNPDLKLFFINLIDKLAVIQIQILSTLKTKKVELEKIKNYESLLKFINSECNIKLHKHELKMYVLGLINNGLIRISNDFEDYKNEVYTSSNFIMAGGDNQSENYIIVLDTGLELLNFIES